MYLRYQQSLRQKEVHKPWMNRKLAPITADIFSQMPTNDSSDEYMHDSFCVSDSYLTQKKKPSKKKSKKKSKNVADEADSGALKKGKLRRIKIINDSSDEAPEETNMAATVDVTKPRRFVKSSSEEELDDEDILLIEAEKNMKINTSRLNKSDSPIRLSPKKFSVFVKPEPKPSHNAVGLQTDNSIIEVKRNANWMILDASLLTAAAVSIFNVCFSLLEVKFDRPKHFKDVIGNLRKIWYQEKLVFHSGIHCDFVISQRSALIRLKWSELGTPSHREHILEKLTKARLFYPEVTVLVLDDRDSNLNRYL